MEDINLNIEDELALLKQELGNIDDLYSEVYDHYSKVKRGGTSTLNFVEKQTANLISLKSSKISLIQGIISAKKTNSDMQIKINKENTGDGASDIVAQMTSAMYDIIVNQKKDKNLNDLMNVKETEEDIDAILEARLQEIKEDEAQAKEEDIDEETQPIVIEEEESSAYQVVFDVQGNMYAVDNDFNILEDIILEYIEIVEQREIDEDLYNIDAEGNMYVVVEFE